MASKSTTREELLELIVATSRVLAKLGPFYERWQRSVARTGGSAPALEFKAQRFMEVQAEQKKQLEQLAALSHPTPSQPVPSGPIPSDPTSSHPVPSHPIPSGPVPSGPESFNADAYQVVEGISGTWHYHLQKREESPSSALCGAQTMPTAIRPESWGVCTIMHSPERYCLKCAGAVGLPTDREFYEARRGGGRSSAK